MAKQRDLHSESSQALRFDEVLAQETRGWHGPVPVPAVAPGAPPAPPSLPIRTRTPAESIDKGARRGPIGLALSGGGIRSATFSLGVLQSLAKHKGLASFDYLSTVSGGGYIGSWLSAWIFRAGFQKVQEDLGRCGSSQRGLPETEEPAPLVWLRKYSNYLTPRVGLLSLDSLTLMSIWFRNVMLNLVIVVALIALLLLLPKILMPLVPLLLPQGWLSPVAGFLGLCLLPIMIGVNLTNLVREIPHVGEWLARTRGVLVTVLVPGILAAIFGSLTLFGSARALTEWGRSATLACGFLAVAGVVWVGERLLRRGPASGSRKNLLLPIAKDSAAFALAAVVAALVVFGLLYAERNMYSDGPAVNAYDYVKLLVFGAPGFLVTFGIGGFVFVGLAGRAFYERSREWWSRLNAWFFLAGTVWFLAMATALYLPALTRWALASSGAWFKTLAGLGWVGSLAVALLGPRIKNLSQAAQGNLMSVLNGAAYVVIIGFVVAIAMATDLALDRWATSPHGTVDAATVVSKVTLSQVTPPTDLTLEISGASHAPTPLHDFLRIAAEDLRQLQEKRVLEMPLLRVAFGVCLIVLLLFGWRVDVNKFSLHNMYKNRLVRGYLGASRKRNPQPFMGFDEEDDLPLTDLANQRPFHIINTALNLAQGKNLAWQERKAASFVLTPAYCGFALAKSQGDSTERGARSAPNDDDQSSSASGAVPHYESIPGYQPTGQYGADDETKRHIFTLGMAMAVSGAAVSPNMGAQSRPALAFVLTLFNARLGRWSANPSREKWQRTGPKFGLICFLQELFGWSNESRNFVYLSDGGHFENLGLYELVRRRCSTIWVVDGSGDPERNCEDLGRAIRQCRVDFGIEIELPLTDMHARAPALLPECGFAKGVIDYGAGFHPGELIYIKPTLCEEQMEPDDVLSYAKREKTFPHQTTADQFFDESQFESYRRLGMYIAEHCLSRHAATLPTASPITAMPPGRSPAGS